MASLKHLNGVNAKIIRAEEHFQTLKEETFAYLSVCGYSLPTYVNTHKAVLRIRFSVASKPPLRVSVVIGDFVHNTRSAMDHLWARLVGHHRGQFPICTDPAEYAAIRDKVLKRVPKGAHAIIDALQPCNEAGDRKAHPLAILNKLSNMDKHQTIHLTAAQSENTVFIFEDQATHGVVHRLRPPVPLYEGTDILINDFPPGALKPGMQVKAEGTLMIVFRESGPWQRKPVHEVLRGCLDFVKDSVCVPLFPFTK